MHKLLVVLDRKLVEELVIPDSVITKIVEIVLIVIIANVLKLMVTNLVLSHLHLRFFDIFKFFHAVTITKAACVGMRDSFIL
jgi:hypothetical protein